MRYMYSVLIIISVCVLNAQNNVWIFDGNPNVANSGNWTAIERSKVI